LALLVLRHSRESTDNRSLVREKSLESVLVVLAQPPAGKDKERLGELVAHKASTLHEHNM
jgi:hypothetical protein